jgi:hypothetical protein
MRASVYLSGKNLLADGQKMKEVKHHTTSSTHGDEG